MIVNERLRLSDIDNKLNEKTFADLNAEVENFCAKIKDDNLRKVFFNCFFNTIHTTLLFDEKNSPFVITGDIPAMWLRDSSVQVMQYLFFADKCKSVCNLVKALLDKQFFYILIDPYANAFNREANGNGHVLDEDKQSPWVWERKFELDSLCYPLWLVIKYYDITHDKSVFNKLFFDAFDLIIKTFKTEQYHAAKSAYYHTNAFSPEKFCGKGDKVADCGLVWSGYRPSDDKCKFGFYLPGNMFIVTVLKGLERIFNSLNDFSHADECKNLADEIQAALQKLAVVKLKNGKSVYALETDGLGNYNLMDDANIPNLLSMPYYEYPFMDKEIYINTREFILSKENPYYFTGDAITGVGSPHTPINYVWPLSVIVQAITSDDEKEINDCVNMLVSSTGGTGYMHESIHKDDDKIFTRKWFAWANSLFSWLVLEKRDIIKALT